MSRTITHINYCTILVMLLITFCGSLHAEEVAHTSYTPTVPIDELELLINPLTKTELEAQAQVWMTLVQKKSTSISATSIAIKHNNQESKAVEDAVEEQAETNDSAKEKLTTETEESLEKVAEQKDSLLETLNLLREERTALIERTLMVLKGLDQKGGDTAEHRTYLKAVSAVDVDVSDLVSTKSIIIGWGKSEEGGIRWLKKITVFIGLLILFYFLSSFCGYLLDRFLHLPRNKRVSHLMRDFLSKMVRRLILAIGFIMALSALGVNMGPVLATIGAAGFVVAFALQDSLSNIASGIMLLLYRPFDVGDFVEIGGVSGTVTSLNLVAVGITTPDNKVLLVPNNKVWNDVIINATNVSQRRVDFIFGIGYDDDMAKAQSVLERIVAEHTLILADPEPNIRVHELADSSVNFICRPWVNTEDYWTVYWDITRKVKEEFDRAGIGIPYPQQDVHIHYVNKDDSSTPSM